MSNFWNQPENTRPQVFLYLSLLLATGVAFFGFFDRYPLFHDEIINTFKANHEVVFDYAARPLYYALNIVAYEFFGYSPRSLVFASCVCFIITALFVYLIGVLLLSPFVGFLLASLYVLFPVIYQSGLRGMPHVAAGTLVVACIWAYLKALDPETHHVRRYAIFAGIFSVASIAMHITNIAFYVSFMTATFASLLFLWRLKIRSPQNASSVVVPLLTIVSSGMSFIVYAISYKIFYGTNFVSLFLWGMSRVSDSGFQPHYQEPWYFYFHNVTFSEPYFVALLVVSMLVLSSLFFFSSKQTAESRKAVWMVFAICYTTLLTTVILSSVKWKFDRVLVGFLPLYIICLGAIIAAYWKLAARSTLRNLFAVIFCVVIAFQFVRNLSLVTKINHQFRHNSINWFHKYYGLYSALRLVPENRIGYIGAYKEPFAATSRWTTISFKKMLPLMNPKQVLNASSICEELRLALDKRKVRYLILNTAPAVSTPEFVERTHEGLLKLHASQQYGWRGIAEIWHVQPEANCSHAKQPPSAFEATH